MNRLALLATTALVALAASLPAFADNATITQTGETNGFASQHQPGFFDGVVTDDSATIVQAGGVGDTATQEQARFSAALPPGYFDAAVGSTEMITQTNNAGAQASQEDNANGGDFQTITQTGTVNGTFATQTVNTPGSSGEMQTATQTMGSGSFIIQTIGASPNNVASENSNTQVATQVNQANSGIEQTVDGTSAGNTQSATLAMNGANNLVSTVILSGNSNLVTQNQDMNTHSDDQDATVDFGNANYIDQYQGVGSSVNGQGVAVDSSSSGRALQYQGSDVTGDREFINQLSGGFANQAGQGQGTSNNLATITQNGGSGNISIQNQGLNNGDAGFMYVNGGQVTHF